MHDIGTIRKLNVDRLVVGRRAELEKVKREAFDRTFRNERLKARVLANKTWRE